MVLKSTGMKFFLKMGVFNINWGPQTNQTCRLPGINNQICHSMRRGSHPSPSFFVLSVVFAFNFQLSSYFMQDSK